MLTETPTSSASRLVLQGTVPGARPEDVTAHLTDPTLVTTWWAEVAEIDDTTGDFVLAWPAMDWTLRGTFTTWEPGCHLAFTWHWDHEPNTPERTVEVRVEPVTGGTMLTISHGEYGPGDEEERTGHIEGWQHFVGRLAERFA